MRIKNRATFNSGGGKSELERGLESRFFFTFGRPNEIIHEASRNVGPYQAFVLRHASCQEFILRAKHKARNT